MTDKNREIDEMRKDLIEIFDEEYEKRRLITADFTAIKMRAKGYRKETDFAAEIFAEIEKIIDNHYNRHIFGVEDLSDVEQEAVMNFSDDVTYDIAELKNKYSGEGK